MPHTTWVTYKGGVALHSPCGMPLNTPTEQQQASDPWHNAGRAQCVAGPVGVASVVCIGTLRLCCVSAASVERLYPSVVSGWSGIVDHLSIHCIHVPKPRRIYPLCPHTGGVTQRRTIIRYVTLPIYKVPIPPDLLLS